jgi:hypothetical protein
MPQKLILTVTTNAGGVLSTYLEQEMTVSIGGVHTSMSADGHLSCAMLPDDIVWENAPREALKGVSRVEICRASGQTVAAGNPFNIGVPAHEGTRLKFTLS